jgi:hypothetical protein
MLAMLISRILLGSLSEHSTPRDVEGYQADRDQRAEDCDGTKPVHPPMKAINPSARKPRVRTGE